MISNIQLKKNRDKSARNHHPWVFGSAVDKIDGNPCSGDIVRVLDSEGEFIAWGHFSSSSQIRVRLLEWKEENFIDESWWLKHISSAIELRKSLFYNSDINAYRLIYAEADMLPGLIVDRYGDYLVLQALTAGIDKMKHILAEQLMSLFKPAGIYERSDADVRNLEGLPIVNNLLSGSCPDGHLEIKEGSCKFLIDIKKGQKTGFFLDQRNNRNIAANYANNRNVLDCFSYTGGFTIYALNKGAKSVTCIDSSASALDIANQNLKLNNVENRAELINGDVFNILRKYRDSRKFFDMIILDPPKLAPTKVHAQKAARAYKDANLLAMKLLLPGGILATFSCSSGIEPNFFKEIMLWASQDAGCEIQILEQLSHSNDHPIRMSFPESEYLKGFILRII